MKSSNDKAQAAILREHERRYDIDWLRIIAVFLVFIWHGFKEEGTIIG